MMPTPLPSTKTATTGSAPNVSIPGAPPNTNNSSQIPTGSVTGTPVDTESNANTSSIMDTTTPVGTTTVNTATISPNTTTTTTTKPPPKKKPSSSKSSETKNKSPTGTSPSPPPSKSKSKTSSSSKSKSKSKSSNATSSHSKDHISQTKLRQQLHQQQDELYKSLVTQKQDRTNDEAWLVSEPLVHHSISNTTTPTITNSSSNSVTQPTSSFFSHSPTFLSSHHDISIVENALYQNGFVTRSDVSIDAFAVLLEYTRKYAMDLISDALDYASYFSDPQYHQQDDDDDDEERIQQDLRSITPADLILSHQFKSEQKRGIHSSSSILVDSLVGCVSGSTTSKKNPHLMSSFVLSDVADDLNKVPLPPIPNTCYNGVILPSTLEDTLLNRSYDVVSSSTVSIFKKRSRTTTLITGLKQNNKKEQEEQGETKDNKDYAGGVSSPVREEEISDGNRMTTDHKKRKYDSSYGAHRGKQIPVILKSSTNVSNNS